MKCLKDVVPLFIISLPFNISIKKTQFVILYTLGAKHVGGKGEQAMIPVLKSPTTKPGRLSQRGHQNATQ